MQEDGKRSLIGHIRYNSAYEMVPVDDAGGDDASGVRHCHSSHYLSCQVIIAFMTSIL
jgi:hypothetical protein